MLITFPICSLMFTLWNGLTMHAWMCCLWDVTQVSVQELPVCECFKDPRINNTEGGTELFYSATFGERKLWVQCFLDLETFEAIHSCHQEWTRGAIKQLSWDTGILSSLPQPLSRSRLCWCEELTRPWSGPGVFHLGVCQELLCRDPSRIVDCYDSKNRWPVSFLTMPRANKRLRSCRCGTLHIAEIKLVARTWSSLAFPRDQSSKGQDSSPFPPEPMLEGPRKTQED